MALHVWFEALNAEVGVIVHSLDIDSDKQLLYRERRKEVANTPELAHLKLWVNAPDEIWIIHSKFFTGNKLDGSKIRKALEKSDPQAL